MNTSLYSLLPSIEEVLNSAELRGLAQISHQSKTTAARAAVADRRREISAADEAAAARFTDKRDLLEQVIADTKARLLTEDMPKLHAVVNATGIVLHTNLGRAPLAAKAKQAVNEVIDGYSNLEIDLESGERAKRRHTNVEKLICELTGAEDCLVVCNNAAAVLLALDTLARGREGVISRGQLVEIGGSFRVPEVMEKSGVTLHEIGTTNKTNLSDYERAVNEETGVFLVVHPSNFHMTGFVESPSLEAITELGHRHGIPTVYDWGCGALYPLSELGIGRESHIKALVDSGADAITFSGDKLLGGPQCGIVIGRTATIRAMESNPLARALRVDKMLLAALEGTLRHYQNEETVLEEIPVLKHLTIAPAVLEQQAISLQKALARTKPYWEFSIKSSESQVGGGSLPDVLLPTFIVAVKPNDESLGLNELTHRLRTGSPSIMGFVRDNAYNLDVRTLLPGDQEKIVLAFSQLR